MFTDIYIKAFDQASATMVKISATHTAMVATMMTRQTKLTQSYVRQTLIINGLTKSINLMNTAVLVGAAAVGISAVASIGGALAVRGWQASMSRAAAVMSLTAEQEDVLGKKTLELAQKWGLSSDVIADGLFELVKSGYEYGEIMEMMEPIVMAAVGNNLDFAQTTTVLMNAQRVFHKQFAEDGLRTIDIIDRMQYAANVSLIDMYDFAEVIEYAGGMAVLTNVRFDELISMAAILRDQAIKSNRSLSQMFINLVKNSKDVDKYIRQTGLGFDVFTKEGTLNVTKLIKSFQGMDIEADKIRMFLDWLNIRGFRAWGALVINAERYEKILGEVSDAEGYAQKLAEDRQKELSRILERLREAFLSAFKKPEYLDRVVEMLENLMPVVTELGLTFATFAVTSLPVAEKFLGMVTVMMPVIENLIGTVSALANIFSSLGSGGMVAILMFVLLIKVLNVAKITTMLQTFAMNEYTMAAMIQTKGLGALATAEFQLITMKQASLKAQMLLNFSMMAGMGAFMAYASGAEVIGHALSVLTGILIYFTIAMNAANISLATGISIATLGAAAPFIAAGVAVTLAGIGLHVSGEQKKFKAEMDAFKAEIPEYDVPTYQHGLSHVPYTGFVASLHQGEGILTREENYDYRAGQMGGTQVFNIYDANRQSIDELIARYGR